MRYSPEQLDSILRFIIGVVFALTVMGMVFFSLYSLVFVTQPMSGIAPADKQFFFLLSDMSKDILNSKAPPEEPAPKPEPEPEPKPEEKKD
jgi:hypothetical protein